MKSGDINIYDCPSGHETIIRHVVPGVTPMFLCCTTCDVMGQSRMYRNIPPDVIPTHEWFKPTGVEFAKLSLGMRDHVQRGGLDLRKIVAV